MVELDCMMYLIYINLKLIKLYLNIQIKLYCGIFYVSCLSYGMLRCPGTDFCFHCIVFWIELIHVFIAIKFILSCSLMKLAQKMKMQVSHIFME